MQISVFGDLASVHAGEMIATIWTGQHNPSTTTLGLVEVFGEAPLGNFGGAIRTDTLAAGISIARDMQGEITIQDAVVDPILIGRDFTSESVINIADSGGLQSQIIFNRANIGGEWGEDATVTVGTVGMDSPVYSATSSSLGEGAVGLAPFRLHHSSCSPAEGSEYAGTGLELNGMGFDCVLNFEMVTLEFYGPVEQLLPIVAPPDPPEIVGVIVEYKEDPGDDWNDVTSLFKSDEDPGEEFINERRILVRKADSSKWSLGSYRITRYDSRLRCDSVSGQPSVSTFTYDLRLVDGCEEMLLAMFDLNEDSAVTYAGDVPAWLSDPLDFNGDASADGEDLDLLLQAADW